MKIRNGFVSNSSTTSFCIYGVEVDSSSGLDKEIDELERKVIEIGLELEFGPESEWYVGKSYLNMKPNETREQFEHNIERKLRKLGLNSKHAEPIQMAWRDG